MLPRLVKPILNRLENKPPAPVTAAQDAELRGLLELEGKGYKLLEEIFSQSFDDKAKNGTIYSKQTGNIYTGSLYLSLASYLSNSASLGRVSKVLSRTKKYYYLAMVQERHLQCSP
jgi:3-hydroxy-3-methylglutaryl CoA synthase